MVPPFLLNLKSQNERYKIMAYSFTEKFEKCLMREKFTANSNVSIETSIQIDFFHEESDRDSFRIRGDLTAAGNDAKQF